MKENIKFNEKSYINHAKNYDNFSDRGPGSKHANSWLELDNIGAWRHERMYKMIDPIIDSYPNSKWLTIGDGRCGTDANYIIRKGGHALATDLNDNLLIEAKKKNFITDYKTENAEKLTFLDDEFDFVLCKESYHHFPRPPIAFYEMMRVAKSGIVLIEPNDTYMANNLVIHFFKKIHSFISKLLGNQNNEHRFERAGNYVFSISRREIEKLSLGIGCKTVAFCGVNDYYENGVEFRKTSPNDHLFKKIKRKINQKNFISKIGIADFNLLVAIIFKNNLSKDLKKNMLNAGYEIKNLPENPFLK